MKNLFIGVDFSKEKVDVAIIFCRRSDRNGPKSVQRVQDNSVWLQATGQVGGEEFLRHRPFPVALLR